MSTFLGYIETLIYCDGLDLFVASDQVGARYLCVLCDRSEARDRFLCVAVSENRLSDFRRARISLREILDSPEQENYFVLQLEENSDRQVAAEPISKNAIPENWFPDADFVYEEEPLSSVQIVRTAQATHRVAMEIHIDPPESRGGLGIAAQTLGEFMSRFHNVIRQFYNQSLKQSLKNVSEETAKILREPFNYKLNVKQLLPTGSVTLTLVSEGEADLFGHVQISNALKQLNAVSESLSTPEKAVEVLSSMPGNPTRAYRNLLEFIIDNDSPVYYEWATPEDSEAMSRQIKITKELAQPVYTELSSLKELASEPITIYGNLIAFDSSKGNWTIFDTGDKKRYSGKSAADKKHLLDGLTTTKVRYRFTCEQITNEEAGIEKDVLWLINVEGLG